MTGRDLQAKEEATREENKEEFQRFRKSIPDQKKQEETLRRRKKRHETMKPE